VAGTSWDYCHSITECSKSLFYPTQFVLLIPAWHTVAVGDQEGNDKLEAPEVMIKAAKVMGHI